MELHNLESKSDERGTLVEAFNLTNDGLVFYLVMPPKQTRGNHYHERKIEKFLVIYGSATMTVKNRDTGDIINVDAVGTKPLLMDIHPNYTHRITSGDSGAIVLVWVSEQFNKDDPDTISEEI